MNTKTRSSTVLWRSGFALLLGAAVGRGVELAPSSRPDGYIARLLINEAPFPGERGYVSEEDTKAAMLSILWVLHSRIAHIPEGYRQSEIATVETQDVLDIITAGGEKGQVDGFYRNSRGQCVTVARVEERIANLLKIANSGEPGRFARLLQHGQDLASHYVRGGIEEADRFAGLTRVGKMSVTGRAYAWMTDQDYYTPGGRYVRITNQHGGALGGNRFFTLQKVN